MTSKIMPWSILIVMLLNSTNALLAQVEKYLYAQIGKTIYPADKYYDYHIIETDSGSFFVLLMRKTSKREISNSFSPQFYGYVYYPSTFTVRYSVHKENISHNIMLSLTQKMASPLLYWEIIDPVFPVNYKYQAINVEYSIGTRLINKSKVSFIAHWGITARIGHVSSIPIIGFIYDTEFQGSFKYKNRVSLNSGGILCAYDIVFRTHKRINYLLSASFTYLFISRVNPLYPLQMRLTIGAVIKLNK